MTKVSFFSIVTSIIENPYDVHFYNNLMPQQAGVKKRLIKLY